MAAGVPSAQKPDPARGVRALVVGLGSIGRRHCDVLDALGCVTAVVSRRPDATAAHPVYGRLDRALRDHRPDYVVIADETARHHETLSALAEAGFDGRVMVEKPLFAAPAAMPDHGFTALGVAYNLRFHPAVQALRAALNGGLALTAEASVGQYLPDWRPGTDYRLSYSADAARGGGVLRDLSHELDLLIWLLGVPDEVVALGGRVSALEIDSDDAWSALLRQPRSAMTTVHLDYLHHPGRRQLSITTAERSLDLDLIAATLTVNGQARAFPADRNGPMAAMHRAMLAEGGRDVCDAATALGVLRLIAAMERSAATRRWVAP